MSYPLCFESQSQFNRWNHYARITQPRYHICTDCSKEYQQKMILESRCVKPEAVFITSLSETIGVVQWHRRKKKVKVNV